MQMQLLTSPEKGPTLQDASSSHCFGEWFFITRCKLFSLLLKLVPSYKIQVLLTTPQNGPSLHARCKLSPPFLRMVLHYTQDASSPCHSWEWSFITRSKLSLPLLRMVLHYQRVALLTCPWNLAVGIRFCVESVFMNPASTLKEVSLHVLVASHTSATLSAAECHHRCCPHPASDGERQTLLLACAHLLCAPARLWTEAMRAVPYMNIMSIQLQPSHVPLLCNTVELSFFSLSPDASKGQSMEKTPFFHRADWFVMWLGWQEARSTLEVCALSGLPALSTQHGERAMTIFSLLYFIYFYVRASVLRISVVAVRRVVKWRQCVLGGYWLE